MVPVVEASAPAFEFLGVLMGVAIRTGCPLELNLPSLIWKPLVGDDVTPAGECLCLPDAFAPSHCACALPVCLCERRAIWPLGWDSPLVNLSSYWSLL